MTVLVDKLEKELARNCRLNNWDLGFKAAIDIVKQHSDWISVDERLPKEEQEVMVVLELTGFYMLAFLRNGIWCNADDGEQIARHKDRQAVTYWMAIPQPPRGVQNG
jgi:hypothetical protein